MSTTATAPTVTSVSQRGREVAEGLKTTPRTARHRLFLGIAGVAMITFAACGSDSRASNPTAPTAPGAATVATVAVTSASTAGASFQLTATARMSDGSARDVTSTAVWVSSNALLAAVSSTGMVTVTGSGELDVRATYQNVTGSMHLSVAKPPLVPVTFTMSGVVAEIAPNVRQIGGARVQVVGGDHTFSDDRGAFAIPGVSAGRNLIEFAKDGYQTFETEIVFVEGNILTVNLYPTPPKGTDGVSATARCNDGSWSWAQTRTVACAANGGLAYAVCPGPLCTP
jgi:hypothetical protein